MINELGHKRIAACLKIHNQIIFNQLQWATLCFALQRDNFVTKKKYVVVAVWLSFTEQQQQQQQKNVCCSFGYYKRNKPYIHWQLTGWKIISLSHEKSVFVFGALISTNHDWKNSWCWLTGSKKDFSESESQMPNTIHAQECSCLQ